MFLWWPSTKIVQASRIHQKTCPPGDGAYFPYISIQKILKVFFQETTRPSQYNLAEIFLWWSSIKIAQARVVWQKNMATRGRGLFPQFIYIENFKNLLVRKHWVSFNITVQKCSFQDPPPRLFKPSWFVKKHGLQVVGLFFPYLSVLKISKILLEITGLISVYQKYWTIMFLFIMKFIQKS